MSTFLRVAFGIAVLALAGSSAQLALATPQTHYPAPIFNANGQQVGSANFVPQDNGGVEMVMTTNGLPPGSYGLQISSMTSCAAQMAKAPAMEAGSDMPVLSVDPRGNGAVTAYMPSLDAASLVGRTVLIGPSLTSGAPAVAVACGVIGSS